jgi:predicted small lipoprotein YifL
MLPSPSIEPPAAAPLGAGPSRRRVVRALLAVLAPAALAACGKKGTLRLPRPGEMEEDAALDEEDPG